LRQKITIATTLLPNGHSKSDLSEDSTTILVQYHVITFRKHQSKRNKAENLLRYKTKQKKSNSWRENIQKIVLKLLLGTN